MDWRDKLSRAKALADKAQVLAAAEARRGKEVAERAKLAATRRGRTTIEAHWPTIQRIFRDTLQRPATAALYNDTLMCRMLSVVYEELPAVVRVVVTQEEFVQFCLDNRHRLLLPQDDPPAS